MDGGAIKKKKIPRGTKSKVPPPTRFRIVKEDLSDEQRQRAHENFLQRQFYEEQRRHLADLHSNQQNALAELKNKLDIDLKTSGIRPPKDQFFITDDEGRKLMVSKEERDAINAQLARTKQLENIKNALIEEKEDLETEKENLKDEIKLAKEKADKDKNDVLAQHILKQKLEQDAKLDKRREESYNHKLESLEKSFDANKDPLREIAAYFGVKIDDKDTFYEALKKIQTTSPRNTTILNKAIHKTTLAKTDEVHPRFYKKLEENIEKIYKEEHKPTKVSNPKSGKQPKSGSGKSGILGSHVLTDEDIRKYADPLKKYGFIGVFMSDEIRKIDSDKLHKRGSLVMNVQPSMDAKGHENPGEHWVGLFWDLRKAVEGHYILHWQQDTGNQGIYFYDPFGREPSDGMKKDIKILMDKIRKKFDIDYETTFEYNKHKNQDLRSNECGYFVLMWLYNMYSDEKFDDTTMVGTRKAEKEVKKFEKEVD